MELNKYKIGIVGAGQMGTGIAQIAATAGHRVIICDTSVASIAKSNQTLDKTFEMLVSKGKMGEKAAEQILNKIDYAKHLHPLAECSIVFEAVSENLDLKKDLFEKIEDIVPQSTIIATNTSSFSIASLAGAMQNKERFIGIHFFNPVPLMALVEIIPSFLTDSTVTEKCFELMKNWGKTCVLAKDTPGFIVNRVARPYYSEALRILDEGIADMATIDWAMKTGGFKMGPFELMDYIGHDVNYVVSETVWKELYFEPRIKPSITQKRLLEAGALGRKTLRGFYDYREGAELPKPLIEKNTGEQIFQRIIAMLVNEAFDTEYLNIATRLDIETAMVKGVNYPFGLFEWAEKVGLKNIVATLDSLYARYQEERYRVSIALRREANEKL